MSMQTLTRIQAPLLIAAALSALGGGVAFWGLHATQPMLGAILAALFLASALLIGLCAWAMHRSKKAIFNELTTASKFRSVVEHSNDLVAIADPDRIVRYLNVAGRNLLGVSEEDLARGITASDFYTPEGNALLKSEILPFAVQHGMWTGEFSYVNVKTKELIPIIMNVFSVRDSATNEVIGFSAVSRDIRDRKSLEKKLDRFFEVSLDMLGIADISGRFVRLNPAFTNILGYTEAELCSRPAVDFIHPDDVGPTLEQIKLQADGKSVMSFENRYRTKDGKYRWFSWKSMPDGEYTYGAARDITDLKEHQSETDKVSREAIAASEAKTQFLANMSHEIRTPLNGIIGMTTLVEDTELNAEQKGYVDQIKSSSEALLTIVNDILDFSKVEAGKIEIEAIDLNIAELVDETTKSLRWAAQAKSLDLNMVIDPSVNGMFRGDSGRIRQVVTNLIGNAIKFTNRGSVTISANYMALPAGKGRVQFTVKDTGIGMTKATQTKLFQAFTQADNSTTRKYGGTGLGLSISKRLVELMGGEIGVDSSSGSGSTFWFTVPLERVGAPILAREVPKIRFNTSGDIEILVAEDNVANQRVILSLLRKLGYKAQAVANGAEVLSMLRQKRFDLILMDCQMPELDGYKATEQIRADAELKKLNIPIIALTADVMKGARERCLAAGMNDYATKPIKIEPLSALIEKWLEKKAA